MLFIAVCALLPSPAQAQCQRWDVSGVWEIHTSNGFVVELNLQQGPWQQTSANITGSGTDKLPPGNVPDPETREERTGVISGNITDNSFNIVLTIDNARNDHTRASYSGTISPSGKISGVEPAFKSLHWVGSRAMKCADATSPISKQPTGEASSTSSAKAGISASQSGDSVTLTWNAGGGHPNAEVWVKVNDHDAKLLFTGPKGTETVTVKPGKKYVYMLRDGGQQLDTAKVKTGGKSGRHGD